MYGVQRTVQDVSISHRMVCQRFMGAIQFPWHMFSHGWEVVENDILDPEKPNVRCAMHRLRT